MTTTQIKDRTIELRKVPASSLIVNPRNWRRHPPEQRRALRALLREIGFADVLLARDTRKGLELIDGHLRVEEMGDEIVPVLVTDLTRKESDKLLLTLDPLSAMSARDDGALQLLLSATQFDQDDVSLLLDSITSGDNLTQGKSDASAEWDGMPEFEAEDQTSWKQIIIHFACREDMDAFSAVTGLSLSDTTRSRWYPNVPRLAYLDKRFIADEA